MKKPLLLFCGACLVALSLTLTSCGDQRSVNRTAKTFLQHFYVENNFSAAKTISTEITQKNIDNIAMMFQWNPNSADYSFNNFKINNSDVRTTRAVVFYTLDHEADRRLNLSKVDGKWLVDMPEGVSLNPAFSLSPTNTTGGFTSAQSDFVRVGDIPESNEPEK